MVNCCNGSNNIQICEGDWVIRTVEPGWRSVMNILGNEYYVNSIDTSGKKERINISMGKPPSPGETPLGGI